VQVLVVDDDATLLSAMVRNLRRLGCAARGVATIGEAIDVLESDVVDILLTDLHLSAESGLDLLRALPIVSPRTAAVLMSGDASGDERAQARRLGATRVLDKPFGASALRDAVDAALEELLEGRGEPEPTG
jgi:DNA-binding NtrC family response regulator